MKAAASLRASSISSSEIASGCVVSSLGIVIVLTSSSSLGPLVRESKDYGSNERRIMAGKKERKAMSGTEGMEATVICVYCKSEQPIRRLKLLEKSVKSGDLGKIQCSICEKNFCFCPTHGVYSCPPPCPYTH